MQHASQAKGKTRKEIRGENERYEAKNRRGEKERGGE